MDYNLLETDQFVCAGQLSCTWFNQKKTLIYDYESFLLDGMGIINVILIQIKTKFTNVTTFQPRPPLHVW